MLKHGLLAALVALVACPRVDRYRRLADGGVVVAGSEIDQARVGVEVPAGIAEGDADRPVVGAELAVGV